MRCTPESGSCAECQAACQRKPGWFLPGEAEQAAAGMGLTMQEFFDKYLAIDWWSLSAEEEVFILSPAMVGHPTGDMFPSAPRGTCVFYQEGRCAIHQNKPHECRVFWCGARDEDAVHSDMHTPWLDHQDELAQLLGHTPQAAEFTILDALRLMIER